MTAHGFPALANIPGHRGAYLLRRPTDGHVEFLALTLWDSIDAIKRFAEADPTAAVVEPEPGRCCPTLMNSSDITT
jgi:heme-degrading monooxygenase HmoA